VRGGVRKVSDHQVVDAFGLGLQAERAICLGQGDGGGLLVLDGRSLGRDGPHPDG
jgi:hypothetical protein